MQALRGRNSAGSGRSSRNRIRPRFTVRRQLAIFYVVAGAALVLLSIGSIVASRHVAKDQAFQDAESMTSRLANYVVSPYFPQALNPASEERRELDLAIADRVRDGYLVEVMAWDATGRVVWASDPRDVGLVLPVPDEATAAIENGTISSDFTDRPEVDHPGLSPTNDGFVEVYVPFPDGRQPGLAFEAYYDYVRVNQTANLLAGQMLPLALVPLVLLQIIQVPIATSLARRIRRQEQERMLLLERNLAVSEKERIRIAADLHDGPIQDLAGVGYALGAIAPTVPVEHQPLMDTVENTVHRATESLRRMMVDLYPPDLRAGQLRGTIADLAVPLRDHGLDVQVDVQPVPDDLDSEIVTTLFRVGRETLANVVEHARATRVRIVLKMISPAEPGGPKGGPTGGRTGTVCLDVIDNGVGFDLSRLDRRAEGHLGLRLLRDRVHEQGGLLTFARGPEGGTVVSAVLPATRADLDSDVL